MKWGDVRLHPVGREGARNRGQRLRDWAPRRLEPGLHQQCCKEHPVSRSSAPLIWEGSLVLSREAGHLARTTPPTFVSSSRVTGFAHKPWLQGKVPTTVGESAGWREVSPSRLEVLESVSGMPLSDGEGNKPFCRTKNVRDNVGAQKGRHGSGPALDPG